MKLWSFALYRDLLFLFLDVLLLDFPASSSSCRHYSPSLASIFALGERAIYAFYDSIVSIREFAGFDTIDMVTVLRQDSTQAIGVSLLDVAEQCMGRVMG